MVRPPAEGHGSVVVAEVLRRTVRRLDDAGLDDAEAVSRQALAHLLDCPVPDLHRRLRVPWPAGRNARLEEMVARLERHEPIAYVVGDVDFRGHRIVVDRRVLIPRPETEQLVQAVLDDVDLWAKPTVRVADVGTGSGCMAVAFAVERPQAEVLAIDASADALAVARTNVEAHRLGRRVTLRRAAWLEGQPGESLDAVVSNPPYVATAEWSALAARVRTYEPRAALDGGPDGLESYRELAPQAFRVLAHGGRMFLEIGMLQADSVSALVAAAGFSDVRCHRDYQGRDRVVVGYRK